jgi:glycosyltransferase involved in cell wall biosynthesis
MIRILLVHPTPTRGGFTAVVAQADELCRRGGYEVVVVSTDGPRLAELPPDCAIERVDQPLASFRGMRQLRSIAAHRRPDIVHLHGRQAGLIGRLILPAKGSRLILYTPHAMLWVGRSFIRRVVGDLAERLLLRRTAAVLCVSHHQMAEWSTRAPTTLIRYLPNNVWPHGSPCEGRVAPDAAHLDEWSRTILVPSGYDPVKRLEVVIEAVALLPEPRPAVEIVGAVDRPDYRDRMISLAADLGVSQSVHLSGEIRDIQAAMRDASLVVLPSFSEGLPIVGLEAIEAGARVAWSWIGGHVELFGDAGAPFWTAKELAEILASDHTKASVASRQSWLAEYHRKAERIRSEYWSELEGNFHRRR